MGKYKIFSRTEKSKERFHTTNEDSMCFFECSFFNDERIQVGIIADGMGGLEHGEITSRNAIRGFMKSFYDKISLEYMEQMTEDFSLRYYLDKLKHILVEAIKDSNRYVCENASPFVETGTTLSVVVIIGKHIVLANVGDSPVYFYRSDTEEFEIVSEIQTQAEMDVKDGKYERYSEEYHAHDHIIYNSIGYQMELTDEDIFLNVIGNVKENDMLLLGSDGAFGRMKRNQIYKILSVEKENMILKKLFEEARKDKNDDQTAILYKMLAEGI